MRRPLDRRGELGRLEIGVVDPDPLGERDQVRRQVGAGRAGRAGAGSPRSSARSRTCRWCRRRGSTRSAAAGCRARSSAGACGPARTASRTARGRGGSARPPPGVTAALQLRPQPRQLVALGLDDVRRRLGDEALVGELALGALDLGLELGAARGAAGARRPRGRRRRWAGSRPCRREPARDATGSRAVAT